MPISLKSSFLCTFLLMAGCVFLVSCADSKSSEGVSLNPTIYYKPTILQSESKCASSETRDLISLEGKTLVTLCQKDYDNCLLQGSCFVDDGRQVTSYNYHSTKDQIPRFVMIDIEKCPYGIGVRNICLDPYFSVAADLTVYEVGEVLFIPRLVGISLPTGETHDGFVIVRDTGGAIKGPSRLDFFTGFIDHRHRQNVFAKLGFSDPKNRFEFRRATAEERQAVRKDRGFPGLKEGVRLHGYGVLAQK